MMSFSQSPERSPYPPVRLNKFNKAVNLVMARIFRAHGFNITREQEAILRSLCFADGVNQAELASLAGQERNNLSRTLRILEEKELISRKVCPADKRNSMVSITPAGRALHAQLHKAVEEYRNILFSGLDLEQMRAFAGMVDFMTKNLEAYLSAGNVSHEEEDAPSFPAPEHPVRQKADSACKALLFSKEAKDDAKPLPRKRAVSRRLGKKAGA